MVGIVMNFSYLHIFVPTARGVYPLFGLTELGNFTNDSPKVPALDAAFGNSHPQVTYCQACSPFIKGLEKRVPLLGRPNLVTYLLGKAYVSQRSCFKEVWGEVSTRRTQQELREMVSATAPLPARLELVATDVNTSFLASFRHRDLCKAVVREGLIVKVSAETLHYTVSAITVIPEIFSV